MQTREQRYAATAYQQIERLQQQYHHNIEHPDIKKYGSMAHKLPVLIRTAGLVQALTFVQARGEAVHLTLLSDLATVVGVGSAQELLKRSRENSLAEYMYLTQETLAALLWFKRFAQSVLKVEDASAAEQPASPAEHAATEQNHA